jgi:hypothetical protein
VDGFRVAAENLTGSGGGRLQRSEVAPAEGEMGLHQRGETSGLRGTGRGRGLPGDARGALPLARGVQGLGLTGQREAAHVGAAVGRGRLHGTHGGGHRLAGTAHGLQLGRHVDVGPCHGAERTLREGLFAGADQLGDARVETAGLGHEDAQGDAGLHLDRRGAHHAGQFHGA